MTVTLLDTRSNFRLRLPQWQAKLFEIELAATHKRRAGKGLKALSEPACIITRTEPGSRKRSTYQLYDRTVLLEPETDKRWPFYFGLILTEWLLAAQPRPGPGKPFNPAVP